MTIRICSFIAPLLLLAAFVPGVAAFALGGVGQKHPHRLTKVDAHDGGNKNNQGATAAATFVIGWSLAAQISFAAPPMPPPLPTVATDITTTSSLVVSEGGSSFMNDFDYGGVATSSRSDAKSDSKGNAESSKAEERAREAELAAKQAAKQVRLKQQQEMQRQMYGGSSEVRAIL